MSRYVLAIDQGTTSSRAIIFDHRGLPLATGQREHRQIFPRPGWVEHDPTEIWQNICHCISEALQKAELTASDIATVGITNQRETVMVWERATGKPIYNAVVWQDTRSAKIITELAGEVGLDRYRDACGLPLTTYFAGPKLKWILDHVSGSRQAAQHGELLAGTMDSWVIWMLSGGADGGVHVTDVTNASRTMLLDIHSLKWREDICADMDIPFEILPSVITCSTSIARCHQNTPLPGVPISGCLGDQHAATFGQACFKPGMVKNTYGTGCFMLMNTGLQPVTSQSGLLTTVAYQVGNNRPVYALEGSVAVAGSLVQWLRDNLGIIESSDQVQELAASVEDNGGVYFVPAFSGLYAPHWRPDARGVICGLTRYNTRAHLARAAEEATAYQTREVMEAMENDSGLKLSELRVDGGMTRDDLLMQFQANQLGVNVVLPRVAETTALGAAYAAGIAVGFWTGIEDVSTSWSEAKRWCPTGDTSLQNDMFRQWKKAVAKSLDWVDTELD